MRRSDRRGQFEIFGIAIFIVLVILGFVLYIMFSPKTSDTTAATYENEQLAQNLVDAMLLTQLGPACTDAPESTYYDLIRDVTIVRVGMCDGDAGTDTAPTPASTALLRKAAVAMIENSTSIPYDFTISLENDPGPPIVEINRCPTGPRVLFERTGEQRLRLLPSPQTAVIDLKLCPTS